MRQWLEMLLPTPHTPRPTAGEANVAEAKQWFPSEESQWALYEPNQ